MILNSIIGNELKQVKRIILDVNTDSEELRNVLNNFLNRESKLIRTITSCLFFKAFGEDINENQFRILAATEIIHNASLIHDDTIDGSVLRRGEASINQEFDGRLSVIAGDFLMSKAVEELLQCCFCFLLWFFGQEACGIFTPQPERNLCPLHWKT